MKYLKWLLFPFALIYHVILNTRNWFYDTGIFKSYTFKPTIICVGNLSVGGTGKSPMIEHLIKSFGNKSQVAVLSRGYKRKTKGFIEVKSNMAANEVGDEPLQFKRKFDSVGIFVDADRKHGIENILALYPKTQIILLDDAFQHRRVKADINILLTTFSHPYYNDFILPVGRLRESRLGAKRADIVIMTKCPKTLKDTEKQHIKSQLNQIKTKSILFSHIEYSEILKSSKSEINFNAFDDFYLITGIANPKPLLQFLNENNKTFQHLNYPDHHQFSSKELAEIEKLPKPILTTEKDFTRLTDVINRELFYIPIEVKLDKDLTQIINQML